MSFGPWGYVDSANVWQPAGAGNFGKRGTRPRGGFQVRCQYQASESLHTAVRAMDKLATIALNNTQ